MSTIIDIGVNFSSAKFTNYHSTLLEHAYLAYVEAIICISNSRKEWDTNINLVKQYSNDKVKLYTTIGIHPHNAQNVTDNTWRELEEYILKNNVVAVGECGLDYNRMFSPKNVQIATFKKQIELANKYKKPLYLHERDAGEDMIQILREAKEKYPDLTGVIHCFTGDKATMQQYLTLGFYIGITGWICDKRRNSELVDAIKSLPLEQLMIETDAPWLIPYEYKKKWDTTRSEPDCLDYIINDIAKYTGFSVENIRKTTTANAKKLFGLQCLKNDLI